jgi:LysR family transcriptional regulator for bpeEF and oprC
MEQLQPGGPASGPLSLGDLRVTGLSQGIWRAAVTGPRFIHRGGAADGYRKSLAVANEAELIGPPRLAGDGLAQLAENIVADHLQEGRLVEVLTDWQPPPVPVTPRRCR